MMLVAVVLRGGAVVYYVNTVLNKGADIITIFMLGSMFASMLGSILAKPFGTRFCKIKLSFGLTYSQPYLVCCASLCRFSIDSCACGSYYYFHYSGR